MSRAACLIAGVLAAFVSGCGKPERAPQRQAGRPAQTAPAPQTTAADNRTPASQAGDAAVQSVDDGADPADANEAAELKLEIARFRVPTLWKRVRPRVSIIDAEYELPRANGDEYDGRLTLMASGGDPQSTIAIRSAEFHLEPGAPRIEPVRIDGREALWVDLRGEWKGPALERVDPRGNYRMVLVIVPFGPNSAFYAKLTGPQPTVELHEAEFRAFLESARFSLPEP